MSLPSPQDIQNVARDVLRELTGVSQPRSLGLSRSLISEADVREARAAGTRVIAVGPGTIVTPLAHDLARDHGITIEVSSAKGDRAPTIERGAPAPEADGGPSPLSQRGVVALGADHGGFALKETIKEQLEARGVSVLDLGTHDTSSCDYPDLAAAVGKTIAIGEASWGILVDGAGIGSCMAANKVPGVLAATCHDERTARNSREHNGANVLCLGSGTLDAPSALKVVDAWLNTPTGGGRHQRRVNMIKDIERAFVRR